MVDSIQKNDVDNPRSDSKVYKEVSEAEVNHLAYKLQTHWQFSIEEALTGACWSYSIKNLFL